MAAVAGWCDDDGGDGDDGDGDDSDDGIDDDDALDAVLICLTSAPLITPINCCTATHLSPLMKCFVKMSAAWTLVLQSSNAKIPFCNASCNQLMPTPCMRLTWRIFANLPDSMILAVA